MPKEISKLRLMKWCIRFPPERVWTRGAARKGFFVWGATSGPKNVCCRFYAQINVIDINREFSDCGGARGGLFYKQAKIED